MIMFDFFVFVFICLFAPFIIATCIAFIVCALRDIYKILYEHWNE